MKNNDITKAMLRMMSKENYRTRGFRYLTDEGQAYLSGLRDSEQLVVMTKKERGGYATELGELHTEIHELKKCNDKLKSELKKRKRRWRLW